MAEKKMAKKSATTSSSRSRAKLDASSNFEELKFDLPSFDEPSPLKILPTTKRERAYLGSGAVLVLVLLFILNLAGISIFTNSSSSLPAGTTFQQQTSGQLALTESEMKAVVKKIGVPVYWAGPMKGAKYTVASQDGSQVYIRYLPDGKVPSKNLPNYRVIGTYKLQNAFAATQKAGTSLANGLGFTNGDGAAVYYNKATTTNVYMAFPNKDQQIEIFDPTAGAAIQLSTTPGVIVPVN